ncbi:uncharacterized protein LOC136067250 [Quercus suber]|uniref:uncharacterized protein LOC136067250 n=1 Tax=Quercus suber TaxID=58331 RepID=UPI0032DFE4FA
MGGFGTWCPHSLAARQSQGALSATEGPIGGGKWESRSGWLWDLVPTSGQSEVLAFGGPSLSRTKLKCRSIKVLDGRVFAPDIRVVHVRDLNFVLRSEIFVHADGQLRASHLILGVDPVYTTWQNFSQSLLVDSPLLSYIDVRHANFLPPKFTAGEARELGPRHICSDEIPPVRDESAERVSRARRERAHEQIQQEAPARQEVQVDQAPSPANTEVVGESPGEAMVTRKTMSISRFIPGARSAGNQQQQEHNQGRTQPSPPPPVAPARQRKRPRTTDQTPADPTHARSRTPPRPSSGIVIREPATQTGLNVASSSRAVPAWQPSFMMDGKPLPSDARVHIWGKGAGGHVAQTLARGLLLPEDMSALEDGTDESMGRRLQWHTIAAAQLAYVLDRRVTDLTEDAGRERALKEVAESTAKEKTVAAATSEKKAAAAEKARLSLEQRFKELEVQLGETELKLGQAESKLTERSEELGDLRAALEQSENKWYHEGFADAENSAEPVINEARRLGFEEGWLAALQALGVPEDSPLRNPGRIPFPVPPQEPTTAAGRADEEETTSLRELVEQIDSHVGMEEPEVGSHPFLGDHLGQIQAHDSARQPPSEPEARERPATSTS